MGHTLAGGVAGASDDPESLEINGAVVRFGSPSRSGAGKTAVSGVVAMANKSPGPSAIG
jgi:hypothetical protein